MTALISRERIRTTLAKAKELRGKVEKTITLGKKGTLHARRHALKLVADKDALKKLFGPLAERYASRPGGYTRVIKLGHRLGDDAPMAFIELVDREGESTLKQSAKGKKKTEETSNKNATDERKKAPEKKKKATKASVTKTTGKKSSDGKKKVEKTAKQTTVGKKKKTPEKEKKVAKAPAKKK